MTNNVIPFSFHSQTVRVLGENPEAPLFVANDVAKALGYKRPNDAYRSFCKGAVFHRTLKTAGGTQKLRVIHEPDVYRLIFGSKLKSAIQFQDWVFEEVLPAIRKTGRYEAPKPNTLTPAQKSHIQDRVKWLVANQIGVTYQSIYGEINRQFKVGTYKEVPAELYPAVCKFLGCEPMESDEIAYIAVNRDELNAVTAWFEVARHRRNQLAEAQRQLNEAVAAVRDVSINLHDPLSEPLFLLHQMVDMKQASKKANRLIQMQDKARTH